MHMHKLKINKTNVFFIDIVFVLIIVLLLAEGILNLSGYFFVAGIAAHGYVVIHVLPFLVGNVIGGYSPDAEAAHEAVKFLVGQAIVVALYAGDGLLPFSQWRGLAGDIDEGHGLAAAEIAILYGVYLLHGIHAGAAP